MNEIKVGDKIYHKSLSQIIWVVEKIEGDEIRCSTIDKETKKLVREKFILITVEKVNDSVYVSTNLPRNRNRY